MTEAILLLLVFYALSQSQESVSSSGGDSATWLPDVQSISDAASSLLSSVTDFMQNNDPIVVMVAEAIASAEGWFNGDPNSLPRRANNPGDITDDGDIGLGTLGGAHITVYATEQDGWNALYRKVSRMLSGGSRVFTPDLTLAQVGQKYANGDSNWARNVAARLGVSTDTRLGDLTGALSA
jgi:hypothetical protein